MDCLVYRFGAIFYFSCIIFITLFHECVCKEGFMQSLVKGTHDEILHFERNYVHFRCFFLFLPLAQRYRNFRKHPSFVKKKFLFFWSNLTKLWAKMTCLVYRFGSVIILPCIICKLLYVKDSHKMKPSKISWSKNCG